MAQEASVVEEILRDYKFVNFVCGTHNLGELPRIIDKAISDNKQQIEVYSREGDLYEGLPVVRTNNYKAYINIIYGCDKFCTYCVVPYTRGRERSRLREDILAEVDDLIKSGYKEITLLGQNVDSYGKGLGEDPKGYIQDEEGKTINLAWLLRKINAFEGKFRIRFVTSYPTDITDELIQTAVELDKVCEYFHIPMQSGDSDVLKAMNRRYDREKYFEIANKIRKMVPDVTITSDFIAGFPGETEEQFQNTLSAMEELGLDYSNTAAYSPREKTVAAKWVDKFIDEDIKTERLARLNEQNRKCCLTSNQKFVGREMEVLVENFENRNGKNVISGRTRNNKIVHIDCEKDLTGEFINVKITGCKTWYLTGKIL
jgi:tRNA-2-methylthio-N6-dimethylallyladenosine synthase